MPSDIIKNRQYTKIDTFDFDCSTLPWYVQSSLRTELEAGSKGSLLHSISI